MTSVSTSGASPDPVDPIAEAFQRVRHEAKKRLGKVPDINHSVSRRKVKTEANKTYQRGRPTGADGRALPQRDRLEGIGEILNQEIAARGWQKNIAVGMVSSHWEELVGLAVAEHTEVVMVKETTLFISCESTAWATNLRLMQRQILQTIAKKVGPGVITELKIFGPKTPSWRFGPLHVKGRGPRDTYG
ncbi:DciA family protein [Corynebacterium kutscheri]|uniref:Putative RNA-binding protein containing Zn ribbon n=1 Tax=Corynebacterium kutscheri TaxID=35755 RepID=A0A0F6QYN6_9CORY|nr:DciA family protein [Corynebacterium kutscheri]AKE40250.1 putative RNA-binding protein containing Zn ribbon [Corynebacterium kutscheri]VEH05582.1 Zn-ribbon-containing, possibly RNA-binding protein and truncated derivatives [Corynebacterium kutscheri]VEH10641.1 Zn-ribbon-containing, possibly RNA-binding protein and truncated derivatives [Corynebacterium kutscheri]